MISLQEDRLQELEGTVAKYRRRFRLMALGYALLAVGLIVAFYLVARNLSDIHDTQIGAVQLVRKAEVFDCKKFQMLRGDLAAVGIVVTPPQDTCQAIHDAFEKLEKQIRDQQSGL